MPTVEDPESGIGIFTVTGSLYDGTAIVGCDCVDLKGSTEESAVREFDLENPDPNPFNPVTTLAFSIPRTAEVSL